MHWSDPFHRCISLVLASALGLSLAHGRPAGVQATFPPESSIQTWLDARVEGKQGVGIILATRDRQGRTRIFQAGGTGRPDLPLDGDTLFEIGSITKTFTTTLLADMILRGEVKLGDPAAKHLPSTLRPPRQGRRQIRLLDLATHTSALPLLPSNIHPKNLANPYSDYTLEMLEQFLAGCALPQEIGTHYQYSAVGLGLLGHALGHRLGVTWEAAVIERVLTPLGMTSTRATLPPNLAERMAQGHDDTGLPTPNWDIPALPAMGALRSSAHDMLKYLAANMDPSSQPLGRAMASAQVPRVEMDEETRVGLGWQTGHSTNRTIVWHGGGTGGFRSLIAFDPGTGLGVVVLCNSTAGADDLGFHLLDQSLPLDPRSR